MATRLIPTRRRLVTLALTAVLAAIAPAAFADVGTGPIKFGGDVTPTQAALTGLETSVGRPMATTRLFYKWDSPFPDDYSTYLVNHGSEIVLSVKATRVNGAVIKWTDIANAQPDSAIYQNIVRWAQAMQAIGQPVWFTLSHEPEAGVNTGNGTSANFIAAWQRVVDIFRATGVTNARFMWIMTSNAFQLPASDRRQAPKWYPGDAYVDGIASDPYNWFTCRKGINTPWRSLAFLIEGQRVFGLAHPTIPLYLTEWASVEDPAQPGRKARWIDDARALFKQPAYAQFRGVSYFNIGGKDSCVWLVTSSATSLASFSAMSQDPWYAG
jgi:Glycosyl hydrolase family 26